MAMKHFRNLYSTMMGKEPEPEPCFILQLPTELLQTITNYLALRDLNNLSQTCQIFYSLINSDDFWIHRIHRQFPRTISQLYSFDLFREFQSKTVDCPAQPAGLIHSRVDGEIDHFAAHSATYYNDTAIERQSLKMFVSSEEFRNKVQYFQFSNQTSHSNVPLMKLIFYYLIDRKRLAIVDAHVVHRNQHHLVERNDGDSFKGRIINLNSVCWLEITGRFEHVIMPGKYEIEWRIKCENLHPAIWGTTEFIVVPTNGQMKIQTVTEEDFGNYALEHQTNWFVAKMGHILVYKPSIVHVAIRNWNNPHWKSGIYWDCVELKLVP